MSMVKGWAISSLLGFAAVTASWGATTFSVTDNNSKITLDSVPVPGFNYGGLIGWEVDAPAAAVSSHLVQQGYWYRLADSNQEYHFGTLDYLGGTAVGNNITVSFRLPDTFVVQLSYNLTGGAPGSGHSLITETTTFLNLSSAPLALTWFEFDDFDLNYTVANDTASGDATGITQLDTASTVAVSVTHNVTPNAFQISSSSDPFIIFDILDDNKVDNLANTITGSQPNDITFGFQWNLNLTGGQEFSITTTKLLIPEPTTGLLVLGALFGLGFGLRRRS